MVKQSVQTPLRGLAHWAETLQAALMNAQACLAAGETGEAEQRAKAICACARAARDVAELETAARDASPEEDVETIRADLRRRIARFVVADQAGASLEELERIAIEGDAP